MYISLFIHHLHGVLSKSHQANLHHKMNHSPCTALLEKFIFKGCKEAFHFGVIKTVIYTAETLKNTCVNECLAKHFACVLDSSINYAKLLSLTETF